MSTRLATLRAAALLLSLAALAPRSATADVRALDDTGRSLTVGNWSYERQDDGTVLRIPDSHALGFELRNGSTLVAQGAVPGTGSGDTDTMPALSRNPATGRLLLVWSHTEATGHSIMAMDFAADAFVDGSGRQVANDTLPLFNPSVVHDAVGHACIAWRRMDFEQAIQVATLALDGTLQGERSLSGDASLRNGAPALGVDGAGRIFVAYFGLDATSGSSRLYVLEEDPTGGGTIHFPEPVLELGPRGNVQAPDALPSPVASAPELHLTVLGGTPVAWWSSVAADGRLQLHYAHQDQMTDWTAAAEATLDLGPSGASDASTIREGLETLEASLRRVTTTVGGTLPPQLPVVPTLPSIRLLSPTPLTRR